MSVTPQAVIFDMDGLLLDSELLAMQTFKAACETEGVVPDMAVYRRCIGTSYQRTREILIEGHGADFPYARVATEWTRRYQDHVLRQPVPVKAGAVALLDYLERRSIVTAVATQTSTELAERQLALAGLGERFQQVVGGDQVRNGKPDPEPYLEAARRLGAPAATCWALEDSDNGVRSAAAAGMFVIQIPDLLEVSAPTRKIQPLILSTLHDVLALLRSLETGC